MYDQELSTLLEQIAQEDARRTTHRTTSFAEIMFQAIKMGEAQVLKPLLDFKLQNMRDSYGYSPLVVAAGHGRNEIVQMFIDSGCDINELANGWNAIFAATKYEHHTTVKLLLDLGANCHTVLRINGETTTPLEYANVHSQKIYGIINEHISTCTSVISAIKSGRVREVKKIVNSGLLKIKDEGGYSLLCIAAGHGFYEITKLLIETGANINESSNGWTPLLSAVWYRHAKTARLLVEQGADVDFICSFPEWEGTPLMKAAILGDCSLFSVLVTASKNINLQRPSDGGTTLMCASFAGNCDVVKALLERGADINITNTQGHSTALWLACAEGNSEVVSLLVSSNLAIINQADRMGRTPLYMACKKNFPEVAKILLAKGAAANQAKISAKQGTPLHAASKRGYAEIVKVLMWEKADKTRTNKDGKFPLNLAQEKGHTSVVQLLM